MGKLKSTNKTAETKELEKKRKTHVLHIVPNFSCRLARQLRSKETSCMRDSLFISNVIQTQQGPVMSVPVYQEEREIKG